MTAPNQKAQTNLTPHQEKKPVNVGDFMSTYAPDGMPASEWAQIKPIVTELMLAREWTSETQLRSRTRLLARYIHWARFTQHRALNRDALVNPDDVDTYLLTNDQSVGTNRTTRWLLKWLGFNATSAAWEPEVRLGRSRPAVPYTADELNRLVELINSQRTDHLQRFARTAFAYGLGVGADGRMITSITPSHVTRDADGVQVRLTTPNRVVAVKRRHEQDVLEALVGLGPNQLIVGTTSALNDSLGKVNRDRDHKCPPLTMSRLRCTYIVDLINRRLPVAVVAAAAGYKASGRLVELMAYAAPVPVDEIDEYLRGAR